MAVRPRSATGPVRLLRAPDGSSPGATRTYQATATGGTAGTDYLIVQSYQTNPESTTPTGGANYFDVRLSNPNTFTAVTIADCNPGSGATNAYWYDGTVWKTVAAGQLNLHPAAPYTNCITITVNGSSTSPTLANLTGTPFATNGSPTYAPLAHRRWSGMEPR